jgi:hypothetical protein
MQQSIGPSWAIVVSMLVCACGGQVAVSIEPPPTPESDERYAEPQTPSNPAPVGTPPYGPTGPTMPGPYDPGTPSDPGAPSVPWEPPAPAPPGLAPTEAPCGPGQVVELSYPISAAEMASGASDPGGTGYCTGVVKFNDDLNKLEKLPLQDYSSMPPSTTWVVANGASFNPAPKNIPGHVHTSTVVHADGRQELQYCTFRALCRDGIARGVWHTW